MSGRSRLFVSSEKISGRYDAVTLRAYLGGNVTVKEGERGGKYGFFIDTASPNAIMQKIEALKPARDGQERDNSRRQISRSYSQDPTDTYSSISSSRAYPSQGAINSNSSYAYGSPQSSTPSTYGASPRTNPSHYGAGMDSLSRQNSRGDAFEPYPGSDRPSVGYMSAGTEPIPIPSQRRPSTFSDTSENSFDSMYGFKGFHASPRGGHQNSSNIYGRR